MLLHKLLLAIDPQSLYCLVYDNPRDDLIDFLDKLQFSHFSSSFFPSRPIREDIRHKPEYLYGI